VIHGTNTDIRRDVCKADRQAGARNTTRDMLVRKLPPSILEFFSKSDWILGTPVEEANKRHEIYLVKMRTEGGSSTRSSSPQGITQAAHRLLASHAIALALCSSKRVMRYIP
jgi:hypothetical protein